MLRFADPQRRVPPARTCTTAGTVECRAGWRRPNCAGLTLAEPDSHAGPGARFREPPTGSRSTAILKRIQTPTAMRIQFGGRRCRRAARHAAVSSPPCRFRNLRREPGSAGVGYLHHPLRAAVPRNTSGPASLPKSTNRDIFFRNDDERDAHRTSFRERRAQGHEFLAKLPRAIAAAAPNILSAEEDLIGAPYP